MPAMMKAARPDGLRLCATKECGTRYDVTKPGEGANGYCNRCRMARARGKQPGPRQRQPPGERRPEVRGTLHPELYALVQGSLDANGVRDVWGCVEKVVAERFGRPELVSPRRLVKGC